MRILAMTDIHGAYSRAEAILEAEAPFHAVVIGGDLTTHGTFHEARTAIETLQGFEKPLFVVAGNMDPSPFESVYTELGVNIKARGVQLGDVGFFGVAGSPFTPMHTPYELSGDELLRRAEEGWKQIPSASRSVFVPHAQPRSTKLDKILAGAHVGSWRPGATTATALVLYSLLSLLSLMLIPAAGLLGAAWSWAIAVSITQVAGIFMMSGIVKRPFAGTGRTLLIITITGSLSALGAWTITAALPSFAGLVVAMIVGGGMVVLGTLVADRRLNLGLVCDGSGCLSWTGVCPASVCPEISVFDDRT